MNRFKYLFKNIGLLTISNFGTKMLTFLLVPLYTNILTTEEYGNFDLVSTTISLIIPILTLDICDSVLRFALDKDSDKKEVFSVGLKLSLISCIILGALLLLNYCFSIVAFVNNYLLYFVLYYLAALLLQLLQNFARGIDHVLELSISGILCTAIMIALNIFFLLVVKSGISGYFLAYILANFGAAVFLIIRLKVWKYIKIRKVSASLQREMTNYSKPLVFNMISWWINNASDRYVVTWICGVAANGIYSVGYKIPSILNVFQTIFNQAWQLSTVKELDNTDSDVFYTKIYNAYNVLMVLMCSVLIAGARILAKFLYAKDFFTAWKYVPFLMIAIVFGAMSGFIGGIFQAEKDSKIQSRSTVIGACCNIVLNIVLTYLYGPIGAAIATAVAYYIVWLVRIQYVKRYVKLELKMVRDYAAYIILVIQSCLLFVFSDGVLLYSLEALFIIAILALYFKECKDLLQKGISIVRRRN